MPEERCDLLYLDLPQAETLRAGRLTPQAAVAAATQAKALGEPTRLTLAEALSRAERHELCVCDLSWICERSEQLVGHHLRVLRRAGLVAFRREGKMVLYRLSDQGSMLLRTLLEATEVTR